MEPTHMLTSLIKTNVAKKLISQELKKHVSLRLQTHWKAYLKLDNVLFYS